MSKYTIQNEQGEVIARLQSKENAALFAAAPDLLDVLKGEDGLFYTLDYLRSWIDGGVIRQMNKGAHADNTFMVIKTNLERLENKARAAIAKAEGK